MMQLRKSTTVLNASFSWPRWRRFGFVVFGLYLLKGLLWLVVGYFAVH